MEPETDTVETAVRHLSEEMAACHEAILKMYAGAESTIYGEVQREMRVMAARMMSAQANAARTLLRLRNNQYTFTYIHQGRNRPNGPARRLPPSPKKLKTNGPAAALPEGGDGTDGAS